MYVDIKQANQVSLKKIFKCYNIQINEFDRKISCPLPKHKERTPSFIYYPKTNTFWCFGCKTGIRPVDFVMQMDNLSVVEAAQKILDLAKDEFQFCTFEYNNKDYNERFKILCSFSEFIRENIKTYGYTERIKEICQTFDKLNQKYKLTNDAMIALISKLKENYDCTYFR